MRVTTALPRTGNTDVLIPSRDGRQVYTFDAEGRHLSTQDGTTGTVLYSFDYDAEGRLASVTDRDSHTYTIVRAASGAASWN